jgi:3-hydroxyisobutyrate dehydrogenase-like beta-hydroxyacid dehydrogenase
MHVAFLGLGTMGLPMAQRVRAAGHALSVWNRTAARAASLVEAGARLAADPEDAVRDAEVVLTMLADPAAVDAVYAALAPGLAPGAVAVDLSTVDPACAHRSDERVRASGGRFLDAPVSGTRQPAEAGTLLIMAAGPADTLALTRPVLDAMGRVVHVGAVGQGMAMKLVLNGLGAHMICGLGAVLALGRRLGLAPATMLEVINDGAFSSPMYRQKGARLLQRDFHPDFTVELLAKDQRLVAETAAALGYPMPTEEAVRQVIADALQHGLGHEDLAAVLKVFERWAGLNGEGGPG